MTDRRPVRYEDYTLDDTQEALRDAVRQLLTRKCPSDVVRNAATTGFDADLWATLDQITGSLVAADGQGAGLVELALVAEEIGRAAAPVPFVSDVVGRRLLAEVGTRTASAPVTVALDKVDADQPNLVPDVAAAEAVIALVDDKLALYPVGDVSPVANQGSTPLGWWTPGHEATGLAEGLEARSRLAQAKREWQLLTGASLVGLVATALDQAVAFAKERHTLGVPIGALQGVAFPLADIATGVAAARNLIWRAAWFADREPGTRDELAAMAWAFAHRVAVDGTTAAAHFHGGLGFSLETDVTLYFLRAAGWSLPGGSPRDALIEVGDGVLGRP